MAGTKTGEFKELLSPFLKELLIRYKKKYGVNSKEYMAIYNQYLYDAREKNSKNSERSRHYQSEVKINFENKELVGIERLYKKTILLEPTTVCAAHCRWCLRGQYPVNTMNRDQISHSTRYIGSNEIKKDVDEVLITGGDPFMSIPLLGYTLSELRNNAPNIKTIRIGTRVPVQDPERINSKLIETLNFYDNFRYEIGVNICHPSEFSEESIEALKLLIANRYRLYNQHPLLKGVNDDIDTLVKLYEKMREIGIESHYLFHAIPMKGMSHHRTTIKKGLDLSMQLSSGGYFSGRSKPKFCLMTDIGKVVLYEGSLQEKNEYNEILIKTNYNYELRKKWVPGWEVPQSVKINKDGTMSVWYQDSED
jgi:lysine 2,3-aminomutase